MNSETNYVTRFFRLDGGPVEEYYHHAMMDAITHAEMFLPNGDGLYKEIDVVRVEFGPETKEEIVLGLSFGRSDEQRPRSMAAHV